MQTPTIGRRVWYWPSEDDGLPHDADQPYDAGVVYVKHAASVNLLVTDHSGHQFVRYDVPLSDAKEPGCAQWMPYQQAQHAKQQAQPAGSDKAEMPIGSGIAAGTSDPTLARAMNDMKDQLLLVLLQRLLTHERGISIKIPVREVDATGGLACEMELAGAGTLNPEFIFTLTKKH